MRVNGHDALRDADKPEPEVISVDIASICRLSCASFDANGPVLAWERFVEQGALEDDEDLEHFEDAYIEFLHAYDDLFGEEEE